MKLPIKIVLELIRRIEDLWFYEIVLTVPGSEASETVAIIETNLDGDAEVNDVSKNGFSDLDEDVLEQVLVRIFRLAYHEMTRDDGSAIEWVISDISRFLKKQFASPDAATISFEIGNLVSPELEVRDTCIVRIDG